MAKKPSRQNKRAAADEAFATETGNGGETHQRVARSGPHGDVSHLTTNQGIRVSDNQNSLKAGPRGPAVLEDFVLREKIFQSDFGARLLPKSFGFLPALTCHLARGTTCSRAALRATTICLV